EKFNSLK
ncbi:Tetratricopeptide repeat, partial [Haemophilus influenzae]